MVIFIVITTKCQGLTIEEKEELRSLRQQITKYRELDTHHDDHHQSKTNWRRRNQCWAKKKPIGRKRHQQRA